MLLFEADIVRHHLAKNNKDVELKRTCDDESIDEFVPENHDARIISDILPSKLSGIQWSFL